VLGSGLFFDSKVWLKKMKVTSQAEVLAVEDKAEVGKVSLSSTVKGILLKNNSDAHIAC
jgi:hypothetical protein